MVAERSIVGLGEVLKVTHGWPFKSRYMSEELTGKPIVVNIGNFRYTGGFRFENSVSREYRGDYPSDYELVPGDLVVIMTCQTPGGEILGVPARVPDDGRTYLHNQRIGRVAITNASTLDQNYAYWLFLSQAVNRELYATASGTKILHTSPSRIEEVEVPLPALEEQRRVAQVLDALQDRIQLNHQMSATLESMASALFKSWFIDFDAVRAKAEGRDTGLPAHVADLFPDSFVESEMGEVPDGWSIGQIGGIAKFRRDSVRPSDFPEEIFDHYSIPAFDDGRRPVAEPGDTIKSNKYAVGPSDVLLSKLNPRIPRVWVPEVTGDRRAICSTEFLVAAPRESVSREYLYCLFSSGPFSAELATLVTGTSGSHQRVRPAAVLEMAVPVPPDELVRAFSSQAKPLLERVARGRAESRTLAELRDSLLPTLMSGELRAETSGRCISRAKA